MNLDANLETDLNANWARSVDWSYPTQILYGAGRTQEVGAICQDKNWQRPLLVLDPALEKLGLSKPISQSLQKQNISVEIFSEIEGNPTIENLARAKDRIKNGKHDSVIAMGGGSALDVGKLAAFMCVQELPIWEFEDVGDLWKKAITKGILPVLAIPTTSGTGSEVGRAAVISDRKEGLKKIIYHPQMIPQTVILDYQLTCGLPPKLTAATGIDAFAHCFEALCADNYHPMADGIALQAMRLIKQYLPIAYAHPGNLQARASMMVAACMGAVAFQKGLGGIHSISHSLGALYNTHHGLTNAILLQPVLEYNKEKILPRIEFISRVLECGKGREAGKSDFEYFVDWLGDWQSQMQIPTTLTEMGVTNIDRQAIVSMSLQDPSTPANPKKLTAEGILEILDQVS